MAGVSAATASRILSDKGSAIPYSKETRARVLEAAKTLRYVPSFHARSLVTGRADTVALLMHHLWAPFSGALTEQFVSAFSQAGIQVVLDVMNETEESFLSAIGRYANDRVDAIFVYPNHPECSFRPVEEMARRCPVISLSAKLSEAVPFLTVNKRKAAGDATRHLLKLQHRRIGYVGMDHPADGRFLGYRDALRDGGLEPNPEWEICDPLFTLEQGCQAGQRLAGLRERPDALFIASDYLAMGVMRGLVNHGLHVPADVAVVSYDGLELGAFFTPPLTTMSVPLDQFTRQSLAMLQAIHAGKTKEDLLAMSRWFEARLLVRGSCGQPQPCATVPLGLPT